MYGDVSGDIVKAVLRELNLEVSPWSYEYRNALSAVEKLVDKEADRAYDLGFEEGEDEGSYSVRDDAYNDGHEKGLEDATFDDVLSSYISNKTGRMVQYIEEVSMDGTGEGVTVRYAYMNSSSWVSREDVIFFEDYYDMVQELRRQ